MVEGDAQCHFGNDDAGDEQGIQHSSGSSFHYGTWKKVREETKLTSRNRWHDSVRVRRDLGDDFIGCSSMDTALSEGHSSCCRHLHYGTAQYPLCEVLSCHGFCNSTHSWSFPCLSDCSLWVLILSLPCRIFVHFYLQSFWPYALSLFNEPSILKPSTMSSLQMIPNHHLCP